MGIHKTLRVAYYHMKIHISTKQFDHTIIEGVITAFLLEYFIKSVYVQLILHFNFDFFKLYMFVNYMYHI